MQFIRPSITVSAPLNVQFSAAINGTDVTIYNVSINGLASLFDLMDEKAKLVIMDACSREARNIK